jgi:hypothetical protein
MTSDVENKMVMMSIHGRSPEVTDSGPIASQYIAKSS